MDLDLFKKSLDSDIVKKSLDYTRKRKKWILLIGALGLSSYGAFRVYNSPSVVKKRERFAKVLGSLASIAELLGDSAETIGVVSKDLKEFIQSDSDEIPNSLKQLSKITRSDEVSESIITVTRALTVGILRGYKVGERKSDPGNSFSDRALDKLFSPSGSGFASIVVGSFAKNMVMAIYTGNGNESNTSGISETSTSIQKFVDVIAEEKCKKLIGDCIQQFVSTLVTVYLDKTMDVNPYEQILSGFTNPKHEEKARDLLTSFTNGAIETLVRTSHQVITNPDAKGKELVLNKTIQGHLATFQPHLLTHFNSLDDDDKDTFVGHLRTFDFGRLDGAFKRALEPPVTQAVEDIQPVRADRHVDREQLGSEEADRFLSIGLKAIASGHIGAIVLAGGQASRLGSDRPKGVLSLGTGLGSSTTDSLLFIQAAQIAHLQRIARERFPEEAEKSGEQITWLVMTSQTTDKETRAHLETVLLETGLQPSQVVIFTQNEIPAFDFEGHALLKSSTQLVTAPDGNGGMYGAIESLLPELEKRGVQYLHIYCVDNILCRVADPLMIGCAIDRKADCTLKVIEKVDPSELVGHVCLKQGKVHVLEYSEIPRELAEQRDHANPQKLFLRAGSIANHLVTLQFLRDACAEADTVLPYHVAKKRIPYWDPERKEVVRPEQPNGIKLERFIFDPFSLCKNVLVWQVAPAEEFSPLKNPDSTGRDCLSTCLRDLRGPKAQWIRDVCAECLTNAKTGN